jgi:hypothetical protein
MEWSSFKTVQMTPTSAVAVGTDVSGSSDAVAVAGFVHRLMGLRRRRFRAALGLGFARPDKRWFAVGRLRRLFFRCRVHVPLPEKQKGHHPGVMAFG